MRPETTKKALDRDLWQWYCSNQTKGVKVSKSMLQARAKWAFHRAGIVSFKASDGWFRRFINRWRHQEVATDVSNSDADTLTSSTTVSNNSSFNPSILITNETSTTESFTSIITLPQSPEITNSNHPVTCDVDHIVNFNTDNVSVINDGLANLGALSDSMLDVNTNAISFTNEELMGSPSSISIANKDLITNSAMTCIDAFTGNFDVTNENDKTVDDSIAQINITADSIARDGSFNILNGCSTNSSNAKNNSSGAFTNSVDANAMIDINGEYAEEMIECLSKFIDTSEFSQTSMDFFYDSDDSSFSTTQNALLLAETENQTSYDSIMNCKEMQSKKLSLNEVVSKLHHRKRGERYLPRFKEKVLSYLANRHTIQHAAKKFNIAQMTIASWKNERLKAKLIGRLNAASDGKLNAGERMTADQQFLTWLRRCRERNVEFSSEELKRKAKLIVEQRSAEAVPKWFVMWNTRLHEMNAAYEDGMTKLPNKPEGKIQYPDKFKHEVAAFAEKKSQIASAKLFHVSRRRVFEWLKAYRKLSKTVPRTDDEDRRNKRRESHIPDVDIDAQLWSWYQAQEPKPDNQQVRAKGVEMYREKGNTDVKCSYGWFRRWCARHKVSLLHDTDDQLLQWTLTQLEANKTVSHHSLQVQALRLLAARRPDFKASSGWALRFCRRHPHLLQLSPTLTTPLPSHLSAKIARYRSLVAAHIASNSLAFDRVGNVDELHLSFSSLGNAASKKPLLLRKAAMANCHATIVLACLADGNMLPPTIILKGNVDEAPCLDPPSSLLVLYQAKAQLDEALMLRWLTNVWFASVATPNLLLADCFPPHSAAAVKRAVAERDSCIKIIPGACTSKLQPLDVAITSSFQAQIEKQWTDYNAQNTSSDPTLWGENPTKFKMPELAEIVTWVNSAYENIQTTKQETIRRSFLVTGLTVSANHSEDHFIENLSMIPSDAATSTKTAD